jgi:aminodeoxyfutalosine synthase
LNSDIKKLEQKLINNERLNEIDALFLYQSAPLSWLLDWANEYKMQKHGKDVFFNRNIHFEPTNKCVYSCKFCAFFRKPNASIEEGAWDYSFEDLEKKLIQSHEKEITEIHITGGVHPDRGVEYGVELIQFIRSFNPQIHIKAFTAVEIAFFARKSKQSISETLEILKQAGLDSLPGGGAEIFDPEIRRKIAGAKAPAHQWLEVHSTAHQLGLRSNATMLYGHIEKPEHRVNHMLQLRNLQDKHHGFMAFIPLRYRNENNALSGISEVGREHDLREFAVARLFLDNFSHLKAYWVMLGMDVALDALDAGVDDLDGTIDDSTKIYSMAGGIQKPVYHSDELKMLIKSKNYIPVERNSLYEIIQRF